MTESPHWKIERHNAVDSTNHIAAERIQDHWNNHTSPNGIAISAHSQSAGKGQHGRSWQSPSGGLYLSAIVDSISPAHRDKLALIAGVAVADALIHHDNTPALIRWPNDILLHNKKVGGILCESLAQGDLWAGIIGIGINANTPLEALPHSLHPYATTLLQQDDRPRDLHHLEHALLLSLKNTLLALHHQGLSPILHRARELDSLRGKKIQFTEDDHTCAGIAEGLDDQGRLLILLDHRTAVLTTATLLSIDHQPLRPTS